jgi:hypothetical protein
MVAARAQSGDAGNVVLTRATAKNPPKGRNTLIRAPVPSAVSEASLLAAKNASFPRG